MSLPLSSPPTSSTNKWIAMLGLGLGVFMATLDASIVNIALPTLTQELRTSLAVIEWVVLAYTLVLTSLLLGVARLGDMYNKKLLYLAGLALFTLASLLCGLAPSVGWLIAFRALQGLGAALTQALGTAIVTEIFPASERGRALGVIGSTVSVGIATGPALGGILIGTIGWRSIFLVNVPIGLLAAWAVWRFTPNTNPRAGQRFDAPGALILFAALAAYASGMTLAQEQGFTALLPLSLLAVSVMAGAVFLAWQRRAPQPMIDLTLFRNRLFGVNLLMGFLVFVAVSAAFILPFFLQLVRGYDTRMMGLLLMVNPIATALIAPLAGMLSDRLGSRGISLAGLLLVALGCYTLSTLSVETDALGFILRMLPLGIGTGLFQSPNNSAIMGAAPRERLGVASGLMALSRTLGQTTGLPVMGALFTALAVAAAGAAAHVDVTTLPPAALVAGVTGAYRVGAGVILLSALLAAYAWRTEKKMA